jgi:uncharacterized protein (DUF1810 family)
MTEDQWQTKADRFLRAQASTSAGYDVAVGELRAGRKQGHWIWYIFPQLEGLGRSDIAERFAIESADAAARYIAHQQLGTRLLAAMQVLQLLVKPPHEIDLTVLMGGRLDAQKMVSSLTLFGFVAQTMADDPDTSVAMRARAIVATSNELLQHAEQQGLARCRFTLTALSA